MAAYPPGYSDPNKYGSAFDFSQPSAASSVPGPANYGNTAQPTPGQPPPPPYGFNTQPPPSYGQATQPITGQPPPTYGQAQTVNIQMDPNTAAMMQGIIAMVDPNNPATNENSVRMKCPSCQQDITTSTEYVTGSCTYLTCVFCFFMGCFPLCWLPFIMNNFKDVIHRCPSCNAECGRFVRQNQRSGGRVGHYGGGARARRRRRRRRR